jgi:hypothetical protein
MILPRMAYFFVESKRTADHSPHHSATSPPPRRHGTVPYSIMQLKHKIIFVTGKTVEQLHDYY